MCKNFPIQILDRVTHADLMELAMLYFDIILGMDWLYKCYSTINFRKRVVRFQFPNELELRWKGHGSKPTSQIVSNLNANKMLSKRLDVLFLNLVYF